MQSVSTVQSSTHAAKPPQLNVLDEHPLLGVHPQIPPGAFERQSPLGQWALV